MDTFQRVKTRLYQKRKALTWVLLSVFIAVGAVLRFYHADVKQLWGDEIHTYEASNVFSSFWEFLRFWRYDSWTIGVKDPPLYYMLNYWNCSSSTEVFSSLRFRLPGIIWGILCIPLVFRVILRFCGHRWIALLTAGMTAFSTYAIAYSQEYRPYSMLMFLSLLFIDAFLMIWDRFSWKRWAWLVFVSVLLIYTHIFGLFLLAVFYVFWAVRLIRQSAVSNRTKWIALSAMPLILVALYVPIFHWLLEFRDLAREAPEKDAYENMGALTPILIKSFATWRFGSLCDYPRIFASVCALTAMGMMSGLLLNWKKHLLMAACVGSYIFLTIGIYHLCAFPFDARRSIGVFPVFLYLWCLGCLFPLILANWIAKRKGAGVCVAKVIALPFVLGLFCFYGFVNYQSWREYDSYGWRNDTGQADWRGMAEFLAIHANGKDDVVVLDKGSWTSLHYRYYSLYYPGQFTVMQAAAPDAIARERKNKNVWFMFLCNRTNQSLAEYISDSHAKWVPFFGGALVYLPKIQDASLPVDHTFAISRNQAGFYSMGRVDGSPVSGTLSVKYENNKNFQLQSSKNNVPTVWLTEGIYKVSPDVPTTVSLFRHVDLGVWNSSLGFSDLSYSGKSLVGLNFPLFEGKPIASLLYNATLNYNIAVPSSGKYKLSVRAKNDIPGPVKVRVFDGNRELSSLNFDRRNNEFDIQSVSFDVKNTAIVLKLYCTSFSRDKDATGPYSNTVTSFDMAAWRLDKEE